jgi:hypothetical protein
VAVLRLVVAALVVAAVLATVLEAAGRTTINPFNLFGYFTIQSNIILAAVLVVTGVGLLRRRSTSQATVVARAASTTYIVIVGLVYVTLLAPLGAVGGVPVPWANAVLHVVTPIAAVVDWLAVDDRRAVPLRSLPVLLGYPVLWTAVVLVRGATDGWVPYPFLDPVDGYARVALFVLLILAVFLAVGAGVLRTSGLRTVVRTGTTPVRSPTTA